MATLGGIICSVSSLATKLLLSGTSSSLLDEDHAIEKELKKLNNTLERIKATLHDAEEREIRDQSVKLWVNELKQVAYAAEDVLDEYQYEVLRAQVESRGDSAKGSTQKNKVKLPDGLADRIKETISQFDAIAKDRIALQLREEDGTRRCNNETQITPTSHLVVESNIFGREWEKEELINLLCFDHNNSDVVSVVTIVGTGGLGKTAIAQLVYNDPMVQQKFDLLGWVCVSEDFSVERLTRDVVESITRDCCNIKNLSVLQEKLKEKIVGKEIFLVLDDVWNEKRSVWESFRVPFLSAKLVKILVTTRNEPVARIMQTIPSFKLGYISEQQCWQLFQQYAFGGENFNEEWKMEIGKQIMKKCGMLPLAVKSIASLLRHETNEQSWRDILESELWELDSTKEIFPPLQISFSRLPMYLKQCLLYCSMFPKDYEYDVVQLTQLWFAHGYIESKGRKGIEEIGRECVQQLFERSFFHYESYSSKFKLHDMIHDLARSNSGNECYSIEYGKPPSDPKQICHLYVDDSDELVKSFSFNSFNALRTLIMGQKYKNAAIIFEISKTYALRAVVFESQCYEFGTLNSIGNLKHLRYLSLRSFTFKKLPESLCTLYSLQTLTLSNCRDLVELPNSIGNLVSLQFLHLTSCSFPRFPESICYLKNLKALEVKYCDIVELPKHVGNLVSLKEIVLRRCEMLRMLPISFCQLKSLKKLYISCCRLLDELPHGIDNLTSLQTMIVEYTKIVPPPNLKKLTRVEALHLEFDMPMGNNHDAIGCLNDVNDLKGTLCIHGLKNATSLADVRHANLMSKHNLESLKLYWDYAGLEWPNFPGRASVIELRIKNLGNNESLGDETDFLLLDSLQPHPNLKKLEIHDYRGITFPKWIGNPFSCTSIEEVTLDMCQNLTFLPFNNLNNLKHLKIKRCHSLQFLQAECMPSQLQKLAMFQCNGLISVPGIQKLKSLVELKIWYCPNLESFLSQTFLASEVHRLTGSRILASIRELEIVKCPKLILTVDEFSPGKSCKVEVKLCYRLDEWCSQNNFRFIPCIKIFSRYSWVQ